MTRFAVFIIVCALSAFPVIAQNSNTRNSIITGTVLCVGEPSYGTASCMLSFYCHELNKDDVVQFVLARGDRPIAGSNEPNIVVLAVVSNRLRQGKRAGGPELDFLDAHTWQPGTEFTATVSDEADVVDWLYEGEVPRVDHWYFMCMPPLCRPSSDATLARRGPVLWVDREELSLLAGGAAERSEHR